MLCHLSGLLSCFMDFLLGKPLLKLCKKITVQLLINHNGKQWFKQRDLKEKFLSQWDKKNLRCDKRRIFNFPRQNNCSIVGRSKMWKKFVTISDWYLELAEKELQLNEWMNNKWSHQARYNYNMKTRRTFAKVSTWDTVFISDKFYVRSGMGFGFFVSWYWTSYKLKVGSWKFKGSDLFSSDT